MKHIFKNTTDLFVPYKEVQLPSLYIIFRENLQNYLFTIYELC